MDNFLIDVVGEGEQLLLAIQIVAKQHSTAQGWAERDYYGGDKPWSPEGKENKPVKALVFYWALPDQPNPDIHPFPSEMDVEAMDLAVRNWLGRQDYGRQPDHDGDNGKGFRLFCEGWGHVHSDWRAMFAVTPAWAMYGK